MTAANWLRAYDDGVAAYVVLASTHERALDIVPLEALRGARGRRARRSRRARGMKPGDVRLPAPLAERLDARARALLPLGTVTEDAHAPPEAERAALAELTERLRNTYPYPDARYAGQMLKPPAAIAWAAYATTMLLNPNNHALDGGPATAEMEKDAVAQLAAMFGLRAAPRPPDRVGDDREPRGALGRARAAPGRARSSRAPTPTTRTRACRPCSARGTRRCRRTPTGASTSTRSPRACAPAASAPSSPRPARPALGAVDDVAAIADLCAEHGARLHVDAAYGGFFTLLADGGAPGVAAAPFAAIARADSVVVDPHKHGLQPYGCGCVLFADPSVGPPVRARLAVHVLHVGRPAPRRDQPGVLARRARPPPRCGRRCARSRSPAPGWAATSARRARPASRRRGRARRRPAHDGRARAGGRHRLRHAAPVRRRRAASAAAERAFATLAEAGWHVAKLRVATDWLRARHPEVAADADTATVLRCCLLKQEHAGVAAELAAARSRSTSTRRRGDAPARAAG